MRGILPHCPLPSAYCLMPTARLLPKLQEHFASGFVLAHVSDKGFNDAFHPGVMRCSSDCFYLVGDRRAGAVMALAISAA